MYYNGIDYINFPQDKTTAFSWFEIAAENDSFAGAMAAGEMVENGDGISKDESLAFDFYSNALAIKPHGIAYQKLGECYENGVGTKTDIVKAYDYYIYSAMDGVSLGCYKLLELKGQPEPNMTLLYKAVSSLDFTGRYFSWVYGGLNGYKTTDSKQTTITRLNEYWDNDTDPVTANMKKQMTNNKYFPKSFVEQLMKTVYSYSYHSFAEEYRVKPNRGFKDVKRFELFEELEEDWVYSSVFMAEQYLESKECAFYEYDFDGCGQDEIGIPIHSGAGGAFMGDGFDIYKKNKNGLYEHYSSGPTCMMCDDKRSIKFEGKYYFILNPFSDNQNAQYDISAQSFGKNGKSYMIHINGGYSSVKPILTKTEEDFSVGFDELLAQTLDHAYIAIAVTKSHKIYSPQDEEIIDFDKFIRPDKTLPHPVNFENVLFSADINNDGKKEVVHKGLLITQSMYCDEYNTYMIYKDMDEFKKKSIPIQDDIPPDMFFGLHSWGSIYDELPMTGSIVQLWTNKYNDKNYVSVLTRNKLLYVLHTYLIDGERTSVVSQTMFFDEVQNMSVKFE